MTKPDADQAYQKQIASQCNNAAWTLVETAQLGPAQLVELTTLAASARYHWHQIGTRSQIAHADLLYGWAMARAGAGAVASHAAKAALDYFLATKGADWELAFAHAATAAACHASQDTEGYAHHYQQAVQVGSGLSGPDATYFRAAFASVRRV